MRQFKLKNLAVAVLPEGEEQAGICLFPSGGCKFHTLVPCNWWSGCGRITWDCGPTCFGGSCLGGTCFGGSCHHSCGVNFSTCAGTVIMTGTVVESRDDLAVLKEQVEKVMAQLDRQVAQAEEPPIDASAEDLELLETHLKGALEEVRRQRRNQ